MRILFRGRGRKLSSGGLRAGLTRGGGQFSAPVSPPTVLLTEHFNDTSLASRGWYDQLGTPDIITSDFAGGAGCLRANFGVGATRPAWLILRHLFTPTPTVYFSAWLKYSTNWIGGNVADYHSHDFLVMSDLDDTYSAPADAFKQVYVEQYYNNGGYPEIALQDNRLINVSAPGPVGFNPAFRLGGAVVTGTDPVATTETRSVSGANGGVETGLTWECFSWPTTTGYYNTKRLRTASPIFQAAPGAGYKGNWNFIECYLQMNSVVGGIGQHNGVWRYWFNGTLIIDRSDILFRTGATPTLMFRQFAIQPSMGAGSPLAQSMLIDHLTIATGRPAAILYPVRTVTVTPSPAGLNTGSTLQLTVTLADPQGTTITGRTVTWDTTNANVATVNGNGLVTAVGAGTCVISASCEGIAGTTSTTVTALGSPLFPLAVSGNGRYFVAANATPFLLHGDAPWSLMVEPTNAQITTYLDDRQAKGVNALLCNLIEHFFSTNPPNNILGVAPFTTPNDFTTPNEAYFARVASIIADCAARGILVLLNPCYMGFTGTQEGWYDVMVSNGTAKLTTFGTYVANRFLAYDNILFVHGTDRSSPTLSILNAIPNAIRAVSTKWLHTFHDIRNTAGRVYAGGQAWFSVNTVYSDFTQVGDKTTTEYAALAKPIIMIEAYYENENSSTAQRLREQAWTTVLRGAAGHVYGNNPVWFFGSSSGGWQAHLNDPGAATLVHLKTFLDSL